MSIVILQTFENLNKTEIEKLLIDKIPVKNISPDPEKIKEFFIKKFQMINPKLNSADPVLNLCLPYVFEPIKELIQSQSDEESVIISQAEINDIINRIMSLYDPTNFVEIFLTLKIKDY